MSPHILALIAGCAGFVGFLCAAPALLVRAIYGPVTDPEHIAALRYGSEPGRETQGNRLPDEHACEIGIGAGDAFTHCGPTISGAE